MSHGEAFWPTVRQAINNNTSQPNEAVRIQCPVCLDVLATRTASAIEALTGVGDPTVGEVLLCGHIICPKCRSTIESNERRSIASCPVCRAKLSCSRCSVPSLRMPITSTLATWRIPMTSPEGADHGGQCPECRAKVQFHEAVDKGEWPQGLDDTEPGFVQLFYHTLNKLEQEGHNASKALMGHALSTMVNQEFDTMMAKREGATANKARALRGENNWFATLPPVVPRPIPRPRAVRMERVPRPDLRPGAVIMEGYPARLRMPRSIPDPMLIDLEEALFGNEHIIPDLFPRDMFRHDAEDELENRRAPRR
ncbi:hypothetical protein ACHAP5_004948 [Fusarium lateritium]